MGHPGHEHCTTLWIKRIEHRKWNRGRYGLHQLGQPDAPSILFPVFNPPYPQGTHTLAPSSAAWSCPEQAQAELDGATVRVYPALSSLRSLELSHPYSVSGGVARRR